MLGAAAEHVSVFLRNASLYVNLDSMFLGTVQGMVSSIDGPILGEEENDNHVNGFKHCFHANFAQTLF